MKKYGHDVDEEEDGISEDEYILNCLHISFSMWFFQLTNPAAWIPFLTLQVPNQLILYFLVKHKRR